MSLNTIMDELINIQEISVIVDSVIEEIESKERLSHSEMVEAVICNSFDKYINEHHTLEQVKAVLSIIVRLSMDNFIIVE